MSKFTLGQRQFPTLGLWSQQPKNYVGPTLSCYLGDTLESNTDLSPSISNDQLSRSQLCKAQHSDPEISLYLKGH